MPSANKLLLSLAFALIASQASAGEAVKMKPAITGFIDMQTITWHNTDDSQPTFTLDNVKKYPGVFGGMVAVAIQAVRQTGTLKMPMSSGTLNDRSVLIGSLFFSGFNTPLPGFA